VKLLLQNLLFTLICPGTVAVLIPLALRSNVDAQGACLVVGMALHLVGASIYLWCLWDFASFGRGTPAPVAAPQRLVRRGLYRLTRNPMYVGVLTFIAGWAVRSGFALGLMAYLAGVALAFHLTVVLYEEPHLHREFGDEYLQYAASVGRWFSGPGRPGR
jgi:protein-S-isoprenylcysteine O-methyltransferase Ste14